jgi:hypothetical protein
VDSEIRWHGTYSEDDWTLPAQRSTSNALYAPPDAASLIVILLLSLGLWAATWGAVDLLALTVLR